MTKIDFRVKISGQRERQSNALVQDIDQLQMKFESDRGRIINSAAIRRLQQKTQVFPLEKNAAVRSRLTHSMEVQQVGRFIVQSIFKQLSDQQQLDYGLTGLERCIESLVEMACLMHDIGNPPFGHFGEQAINQWFEKHFDDLVNCTIPEQASAALSQSQDLKRDILQFEGNAQAIRLVHSLLNLNLTYSQAAGIMKYTRIGTQPKLDSHKGLATSYLQKKVGFYYSEKHYVESLCQTLQIDQHCRHPISYIMEAADDISYCLADIEDAVEKGLLNLSQLSELLITTFAQQLNLFGLGIERLTEMQHWTERASKHSDQYFISLRVSLTHPLVKHAANQFIENIEAVYHGCFNSALLEDKSYAHAITETLKKVAREHVFCHPEVEKLELQGYRIINGLLDCYRPLLTLDHATFSTVIEKQKNAPLIEKHLAKKLPSKHLTCYLAAVEALEKNASFSYLEFYYRCRLIQDYISGMTDQFAYDEYRNLMVID
jgi:dGTPase